MLAMLNNMRARTTVLTRNRVDGISATTGGANRQVIHQSERQEKRSQRPVDDFGIDGRDYRDKATEGQNQNQGDFANHIKSSPAKSTKEDPCHHVSENAESEHACGQLERVVCRKASLFVEVRSISHQGPTTKGLRDPNHGSNLCPTAVSSAEAVEEGGAILI